MNQLGGQAMVFPMADIQLSRGETVADTARVLSRYLDGLVIRTFDHAIVEEWAREASIPNQWFDGSQSPLSGSLRSVDDSGKKRGDCAVSRSPTSEMATTSPTPSSKHRQKWE